MSGETAITRADLDAAIGTAVNKLMLSQIAVAGLTITVLRFLA